MLYLDHYPYLFSAIRRLLAVLPNEYANSQTNLVWIDFVTATNSNIIKERYYIVFRTAAGEAVLEHHRAAGDV